MNSDGTEHTNANSPSSPKLLFTFVPGRKVAFASGGASSYVRWDLLACASALLVLTLLLLLAGCSSSEESGSAPEEDTAATEAATADDTTAGGMNPTRLTNLGAAVEPIFSPDGEKIAFSNHPQGLEVDSMYGAHPRDPSKWLYLINADGSDPTRLTNNTSAHEGQPAFSPDGEKIAFSSGTQAEDSKIYVASSDGTALTNLTNNPAGADMGPTWSPNGKKIAFLRRHSGRNNTDIYVMNSDGTNPTNITNTPVSYRGSAGSWSASMHVFSPKEEKKAFMSNRELPTGIDVMNSDGTNLTRLTTQLISIFPRFSPDGKRIAFVNPPNIYLMNSDGTDITRLYHEERMASPHFLIPVFSPDSKKVAFRSNREGNDEIYTVNTDGTNLTNVTNNASAHDSDPSFSPDGKKMAFVSQSYDESGRFVSEIYLMNLD